MHLLRPLNIIDAELNLVGRELVSRLLLCNAETYGKISYNNRGDRSVKMSHDAVMPNIFPSVRVICNAGTVHLPTVMRNSIMIASYHMYCLYVTANLESQPPHVAG